jgi:TRAP-type C4-dicarboxylate transport system permease small subunit
MDDKINPYIGFEDAAARQERTIKRLWILCLVLIVALIATNGAWLYWESQWEDVVVTQDNEDGYNNYVGNDGYITN